MGKHDSGVRHLHMRDGGPQQSPASGDSEEVTVVRRDGGWREDDGEKAVTAGDGGRRQW